MLSCIYVSSKGSHRRSVALAVAAAAVFFARPVAAATTDIYDSNPATTGAQDGNGSISQTGLNFYNGTTNVAPATGDIVQFGNTTGGFTINVSNGGSPVNFPNTTNITKSYSFTGDALEVNQLTLSSSVTASFSDALGTATAATQNWFLNTNSQTATTAAAVLNLSGGGLLQNFAPQQSTSTTVIPTVNLTAGNYTTGDNGFTTPTITRPSFESGTGNLIVNQSGGTVTGSFVLGAGATPVTATAVYNLTTGAVISLSGADLVIGEGGTTASGSATLNVSGSVINTSGVTRSINIGGRGAAGNSAGNGALNVTAGAITLTGAGFINLGDGSITSATVNSQFNVSGGSVATGATGGIRFGLAGSSYGTGSVASFNLTGGSVFVGTGGLISAGATTLSNNVNLGGGTLGALGNFTTTLPITLTGTNGAATIAAADNGTTPTPHNITLGGAISGNGGLIKIGAGSLLLSVANTFAGGTTISDGTFEIGSAANAGSGNITVMPAGTSTGALLQLDSATTVLSTQSLTLQDNGSSALASVFLNYNGTDTIFSLSDDGTLYSASGTYGAPGSGADHPETFLSGSGFLQVTPEPAAISTVFISSLLLIGRRRSKPSNVTRDHQSC